MLVYLPDPNLFASCWNNVPVPDAVVVSSSSSVVVADVVLTDSSAFLQGTGADVVLMLNLFINPIPILGGRVDTSEQRGRSELSMDAGDVVICSVVDDDGSKVVITSFPSLKESAEPSPTSLPLSTSSSSPPWLSAPLAWAVVWPAPWSMLFPGSHPGRLDTAEATMLS